MRAVFAHLIGLVAPPACAACGAPPTAADEVLCVGCRRELPWLPARRCPRCGLPAPCRPCPARGAAFAAAWAPVAHEGPARRLVAALKFRGALRVADTMAAQIAAQAPPRLLAGATLVPVPLHPARRRTRGFDQTRLLTEAVGRRAGRPVAACLRRGGPATRQLGARRARRLLPGRIVVSLGEPAPELAALVDDVHTTGATLDACARVLRAGGAREVVCLTYARALRR